MQRYVEAVKRNDQATATAALGGAPNQRGLNIGEQQFLFTASQITKIAAKPAANGNTTVEVWFSTPKGNYFETFVVAQESGASIIVSHQFTPL